MGYMGLDKGRWFSDGGLDFKITLEETKNLTKQKLNELISEELKDNGNCYNPDGATHISLLIEDGVIDRKLLKKSLINKLIDKMGENVSRASVRNSWGKECEENRKTHYKWYSRLLKVIENDK